MPKKSKIIAPMGKASFEIVSVRPAKSFKEVIIRDKNSLLRYGGLLSLMPPEENPKIQYFVEKEGGDGTNPLL